MMGPTHRLFAASAGLELAQWAAWPAPQAAAAALLAAAVGGGRLSPDLDQHWAWRVTDKLLPDELLGAGGPMQHRGITHWWGLPVAALLYAQLSVPAGYLWIAYALLVGWASHLVGDWLFGKKDPYCGRGRGIPMMPWWRHVGLGLDVGGGFETVVQLWLLPAGIMVQSYFLVRGAR